MSFRQNGHRILSILISRPPPLLLEPCVLLLPVRRFINCASQQIAAIIQGPRAHTNCGRDGRTRTYKSVLSNMSQHVYVRFYPFSHLRCWCTRYQSLTGIWVCTPRWLLQAARWQDGRKYPPRHCGVNIVIQVSLGGRVRGHQRAQAKFREPPSLVPRVRH